MSHAFERSRASAFVLLCLLCALAPAQARAFDTAVAPADTTTVEGVRAAFASLTAEYLDGEGGPNQSSAYAAAKALLARGLNRDDAEVAAETIFRGTDLTGRLEARKAFLYALVDSARAYRPRDTSRANRGLFLLAEACVELQRGSFNLVRVLADSSLRVGGAQMRRHTQASTLMMGGFALSRLNQPAEAYDNFERAAAIMVTLPGERAGYISALEAGVRCLVTLGRYEEALAGSALAIEALATIPGADTAMAEAYSVHLARGQSLAATGDADGAFASLSRARAIAERREDFGQILLAGIGSAETYLVLGDDEGALRICEDLITRARTRGDLDIELQALSIQVTALEKMGRLAEALAAERRVVEVKDLIHGQTLDRQLEDLRERHAYDDMNQRLVVAEAENATLAANAELGRVERTAWLLGAGIVLALILALGMRLRSRRRMSDELQRLVDDRTAEIEAQRASLEAQARALKESNAELERFAYIASHDLKTPIRNVTSFLGLIERRLPPDARAVVQEYLDIAGAYARQMHVLVTDVLEFSRIDSDLADSSEAVDVAGMLGKLRRQLEPGFAARNGRLEVSGRGTVLAPPAYLARLLTNLIDNGLKYNRSVAPTVTVSIAERSDGTIAIRVTDNGIGIAPEYQERVFEMFKRLHTGDEFQGTGLGLAVCRKVAERLRGSIRLVSAEGEGSEFTVVLPAGRTSAVTMAGRQDTALA